MDVRPYAETDRAHALQVFDSNVPAHFAASERADFEEFLDAPDCTYFVMEHEGALAGCGGFAIEEEPGLASLVWGMIRADLHHLGLGRLLLMYRLREIGKVNGIERVRLDTSQHVAPFFEKQGFKVVSIEKDSYAKGLDRVEMIKRLTVCT